MEGIFPDLSTTVIKFFTDLNLNPTKYNVVILNYQEFLGMNSVEIVMRRLIFVGNSSFSFVL